MGFISMEQKNYKWFFITEERILVLVIVYISNLKSYFYFISDHLVIELLIKWRVYIEASIVVALS